EMARANNRKLSPHPVHVGAKVRRLNPWFEMAAASAKRQTVQKHRRKFRAEGPKLNERKLTACVDQLEKVQRKINPLEAERERLVKKLLAHWGHTGIERAIG